MARDESSREDLLAEATALVERIEFVAADGDTVVAGFRRGGEFSAFFGEDPAYHFNADNQLRRAYYDGLLIKANDGRLVSLKRVRTENETQLVRHELSGAEHKAFVAETERRLQGIKATLESGTLEVIGQIPADANIVPRVRDWLAAYKICQIAKRPNL